MTAQEPLRPLMNPVASHDPLKCSNPFVMLRITPTDITLRQDPYILLQGPFNTPSVLLASLRTHQDLTGPHRRPAETLGTPIKVVLTYKNARI